MTNPLNHPCLLLAINAPAPSIQGVLFNIPDQVSLRTPASVVYLGKYKSRTGPLWRIAKELRDEVRHVIDGRQPPSCATWIQMDDQGKKLSVLLVEPDTKFPGGFAFHHFKGRLQKLGWKWTHTYLDGKRKASGGQMEIAETGRILALDLGTTTGYARSTEDRSAVALSGILRLSEHHTEHKGSRFLRFRVWLEANTQDVSHIFYEEVKRHQGTEAAHIYGGLKAILLMVCAEKDISVHGVGVMEVKRLFAGKGTAKKEHMIAAAERRGFTPADDNEADAIGILHFGIPTLMSNTTASP